MTPEELFEGNQGIAHWYLNRYLTTRVNDEDYQQIAMIGLWRAACSYDESRGCTFTTYAVACIRGEFLTYHTHLHRSKREGNLSLISLDQTIPGKDTDESDTTLLDTIEDPKSLQRFETIFDREVIDSIKNSPSLKRGQRELISLYSEGYTHGEILKKMGVTRQRLHYLRKDLKRRFGKRYYG